MTFEEAAPGILGAVRSGASLDEAARRVDVPIGTVRSWAARGRKNLEGRYGAWVRDLDESRQKRVLPRRVRDLAAHGQDGPMTREEAEHIIVMAMRNGSLQAVRLWLEIHPASDEPPRDELSWLEQGT